MQRKKISKKIIVFLIFGLAILPASLQVLAEKLSSPNYNIENPEFNGGGGLATSTNYRSQDSLSGSGLGTSTSANYQTNPGFVAESYPGVPGQPTLTNTGGNMYNTLDFVITTGNNRTDVNYAIAISTDGFATTNFVQADDTVGANPVWQTYTAWGGATGQRLVSLAYNTTYTIKVKARFGLNSESGYSLTASAATVNATLTVTIVGLTSGSSVAGQTTNVTATPTTVPFSTLQPGTIKVGAQTITVTTNANAGYTVGLVQDQDLTSNNGNIIKPVTAPNSAPAAWPGSITDGRFGYHTTDSTLCTGTQNRFSVNDTYAAASTTPFEISCNTGPASNDANTVVFKVEVESLQPTGFYTNKITYITTAQY